MSTAMTINTDMALDTELLPNGLTVDEARQQSFEEVRPEDEGRMFYQLPIWKRVVIMMGGPVMNLVLAVAFAPLALFFTGFLGSVGAFGVGINLLLAGFNMIPFGPLDGRKVLSWSVVVFAVTFVVSAGSAVFVLFRFGLGL